MLQSARRSESAELVEIDEVVLICASFLFQMCTLVEEESCAVTENSASISTINSIQLTLPVVCLYRWFILTDRLVLSYQT